MEDFDIVFQPSEVGWKLRFQRAYSNWKNSYKQPTNPPLEVNSPRAQTQGSSETSSTRRSVNSTTSNAIINNESEVSASNIGSGLGEIKFHRKNIKWSLSILYTYRLS